MKPIRITDVENIPFGTQITVKRDKYINNLIAVGKYRAVSYGGNVISISDAEVYLGWDALKIEEWICIIFELFTH